MKNGALSFSILLAVGSIAAAASSFAGCSSEETAATPPPADSGTDSKPPVVVVDAAPVSCQQPLGDFMCSQPAAKAGSNVCTDKMLNEFLNCFNTPDAVAAKCTAARTMYAACFTCALTTWFATVGPDPEDEEAPSLPDEAACIKKIDPASACGQTVKCTSDCLQAVCGTCSTEEGSGRTASSTESSNCYSDTQFKGSTTREKGKCYDIATKDYAACKTDARFASCFISDIPSLIPFWRGACRDNGDWTNANMEDGTLTAPTDAGTTDTGTATDTGAATDSGAAATDASTDAPAATDAGSDSGLLSDVGLPG